jgi:quercetin dioxygenase-like cupin family protein
VAGIGIFDWCWWARRRKGCCISLATQAETKNPKHENQKMSLRRFIPSNDCEIENVDGKSHFWYLKEGLGDSDAFTLVRARIVHGSGHPFHTHPEMDEIIYVLEGEMEQWIEKEKRIVKPGDAVFIPRGVVHGCYNESNADCTFLAVLTPGKIKGEFSVDQSQVEPWKSLK